MRKEEPVVYVVFPTANPIKAVNAIKNWVRMGYSVFSYCDNKETLNDFGIRLVADNLICCHLEGVEYKGYWWACNKLINKLFSHGSSDIVVLAADDMDPDPNKTAQEIGREYFERFPDGEGIMQPCGDTGGEMMDGKYAAERICGSPWFGYGWFKAGRFNGKATPEEFFHFYGDEVIKEVAEREGLLWMRKDLCQKHHHWSFYQNVERTKYQERNSREHWQHDKDLFFKLKELGFPEEYEA